MLFRFGLLYAFVRLELSVGAYSDSVLLLAYFYFDYEHFKGYAEYRNILLGVVLRVMEDALGKVVLGVF